MVVLELRVDALELEVGKMHWEWSDFKEAQTQAVNAIQETQAEHTRSIGGLRTEVGGLRTEVGGLRTEVGGLAMQVGGLRTDVGGLALQVSGLRTEVDGLRETQLEHGRILHELRLGMGELVRSVKYLMRAHDQSAS